MVVPLRAFMLKLWLKSSKIMFKSKQVIRFLTRHLYYNPLKFSSNLDIRVNINRENLTGRKRIYRYSPGVTLFLMSSSKQELLFMIKWNCYMIYSWSLNWQPINFLQLLPLGETWWQLQQRLRCGCL